LFNVGDQLVFNTANPLPVGTVWQIVGYGIIYTVAFILLAQVNFRKREI
jgi:ABC-type transport system involved in multi-copper enzyme maturation permease subunit